MRSAGRDEAIIDLGAGRVVERLLRAVREHLDLDVAFVGEVTGDERIFRHIDARAESPVAVGGRDPLDESYCGHVLAGRIPAFLPDPLQDPVAASLPVTAGLPVGTHLSVPIRFSDGRIYGTFCCFSHNVRHAIDVEDLRAVRMMAELASDYLEAIDTSQRAQQQRRLDIEAILDDPAAVVMVFQPQWDLATLDVVAVEALARFPGRDGTPDGFFSQAASVGLGVELEMKAIAAALAALDQLPAAIRLSVNVSPETLCSSVFLDTMAAVPGERLMVEVTEHAAIEDYTELRAASARLRARGIGLAVDDVGMGFSGLNRILESSPQELKLDAVVIRDVHRNPVKQALIASFCGFGRRAGFNIIAEGIETADELACLKTLGVRFGQGYHLARPAPLHHLNLAASGPEPSSDASRPRRLPPPRPDQPAPTSSIPWHASYGSRPEGP